MLRRLTKNLKYAVVYFPVDDSVSRIATKDVVMVEGGGEMKENSKVFVMVKRERYLAYILYLSGNNVYIYKWKSVLSFDYKIYMSNWRSALHGTSSPVCAPSFWYIFIQ